MVIKNATIKNAWIEPIKNDFLDTLFTCINLKTTLKLFNPTMKINITVDKPIPLMLPSEVTLDVMIITEMIAIIL
jgi:hypothetical protein